MLQPTAASNAFILHMFVARCCRKHRSEHDLVTPSSLIHGGPYLLFIFILLYYSGTVLQILPSLFVFIIYVFFLLSTVDPPSLDYYCVTLNKRN